MTKEGNSPLVSFAVLSYNSGKYICECINSILNLEGGYDFEIIVVDDASTDDSQSVVRSYTDGRVHFIFHERNLGHAATVNDAMAAARGDYIARIDADDRYRPNFLTDTLKIFDKFPEVGLVYGDVDLIDESGQITCERSDRVHGGRDFKGNEFVKLLEYNFICSPSVIARRKAWKEVLPAPGELVFHDWYFTVMIARRHEFYYISKVVADYRVHHSILHLELARNKSFESSIFWFLDHIYSERERIPELEKEKVRRKGDVYGAQYVVMANKYFGFGMYADARRCYLNALRFRPGYIMDMGLVRRLAGIFMGRRAYEFLKSIARALFKHFSRRQA